MATVGRIGSVPNVVLREGSGLSSHMLRVLMPVLWEGVRGLARSTYWVFALRILIPQRQLRRCSVAVIT